MASCSLICANDNIFNKAILEKDAYYFKSDIDVTRLLNEKIIKEQNPYLQNNLIKIKVTGKSRGIKSLNNK
jgi:hypothetical protein